MSEKPELLEMAAEIVAAYVSRSGVTAEELPALIQRVYGALASASQGEEGAPAGDQKPAVSIKKSITPDFLICLEDGHKFRSLKRHLWTHYNLTPDQYRDKWGLPRDYPMVAPNYAAARSKLAKQMGLGQRARARRKRAGKSE